MLKNNIKKYYLCRSHFVILIFLASFSYSGAQNIVYTSASVSNSQSNNQQNTKNRVSLKSALKYLEIKYDVAFVYDSKTIENKKVGKNRPGFASLQDDLKYLLDQSHLVSEKLADKTFLILPVDHKQTPGGKAKYELNEDARNFRRASDRLPVDAIPSDSAAKTGDFRITGNVTSEDGEPLSGVSVILQGMTKGSVTDNRGNYVIIAPDANGTLIFSFIGYSNSEVAIGSRNVIDVVLVRKTQLVGEVVVVGYGTQKKKDLTGSVATVSGEDLSKVATYNVTQALQGKVAGVYVLTNSGEPGSGLSVRVRGMGGFGSAEPLYVIDGVILTYPDNSALNMTDIESINVLKDASASAIYGARAGNGVVIITTKRGKAGTPKMNFDTYYGIQKVNKQLDMMNAAEYAAQSNDSRTAAGAPLYSKFANPSSLGEGTDWQDAIFRSAMINSYQLSVSGGGDKSRYYLSGGYLKQDGIILNSTFDRYSLRANIDAQPTSWFKIGNSLSLNRTHGNALAAGLQQRFDGIVATALGRSPTLGIYNPDGSWAGPDAIEVSQFLGQNGNPVRKATLQNNPQTNLRALGNVYGEVQFMKSLSFKTSAGFDYFVLNLNEFKPTYVEGALPVPVNEAFQSKTVEANLLTENTLTYRQDFGLHHIDALVGYTAQLRTSETVDARSRGQLSTLLTTVDAGASTDRISHGSRFESSYTSYLGRINYSFADKYLLTANIRRDGSSVFSRENKYATFPSFSAGWRISKENFMKSSSPIISDLKLRASWGQVGIDGNLGGTEYATISSGFLYNFGGIVVGGMTADVIPNPELKWETVTQTDVGLDLSLFQNQVTITADYFEKKYTDMITQKAVPIYAGISDASGSLFITQPVNSASVNNKGFEFSVNYQNNDHPVKYDVGVNFTTFSNKVVKLDDYIAGGNLVNTPQGFLTRTMQGHSVGEFFGYVTDGIFQSQAEVDAANAKNGAPDVFFQNPGTAPGDIRFKDINNDKIINDADRTFIGSPIPKFTIGVNGNLEFKQFDLNLGLQGVYGNKIINANRFVIESTEGNQNKSRALLNRWTPSNPSNTMPRVIYTDPNFNDRPSDRFVEDGSYMRLRTLQIGYRLNASIIRFLHLTSARVYFTAQNLITITKYTGYNPDIGAQLGQNTSNGIDDTIYPQSKTFLAGISIGF